MASAQTRSALSGARHTALWLWGGLVLGMVLGIVASDYFGHIVLQFSFGLVPPLLGMLAGGWVWGSRMCRLAGSGEEARMRRAGVLGFVPAATILIIGLALLESSLAFLAERIPVHRIFTLLFVPTAFLIMAAASFALGVGLRDGRRGLGLAWRAGLAAAGAFLLIDLVMEAFGWRVGGPGAAERYTMLTVTFAGALGSALAGGGVLGYLLSRHRDAGAQADHA